MPHSEVWVNLIKTGGNPPQKTLKNKGLLVFKNIPVFLYVPFSFR